MIKKCLISYKKQLGNRENDTTTAKRNFGMCASVIGFIDNVVLVGYFEIEQHRDEK